jgi:hypothetical protein
MNIFMACPAPRQSRKGNRVTAERWAGLLRGLGHRLTIGQDSGCFSPTFNGLASQGRRPCDVANLSVRRLV